MGVTPRSAPEELNDPVPRSSENADGLASVRSLAAEQAADAVASADPAEMLRRPWRLDPQVALRPEPFGALAYHFGTRRLSLLKSPALLDALERLDEHASAVEALRAAGVAEAELPPYAQALATLARAGMIHEAERK